MSDSFPDYEAAEDAYMKVTSTVSPRGLRDAIVAALGDTVLYKVGPDGPYDLEVDNGVFIENITDDLVNGGILVRVWPEGDNDA